MRLADLTLGASAVVTAVSGDSRIASRLMEMGFVPGAAVQVLRRAPFGGPIQYRVHGVSMRIAEAACISVTNDAAWLESHPAAPVGALQLTAT